MEIWGTELVELVAYCASKCHAATTISCSTFAECLNDLAGIFCQVFDLVIGFRLLYFVQQSHHYVDVLVYALKFNMLGRL